MMDEELSINITIAERRYPMKVKRSEEEKIRKAAKVINERILQYQRMYTGRDYQDFLAMSALQFAIQVLEMKEKSDVNPAIKQIEEINQQLAVYLQRV
jgi:cell division protein ZapA